jgi:predicted small secreted protein
MKGIERMSKVRMTMLVLAGALFVLTGCNTIAGVGQDISGSARAVQHAL